MAGPLICADFNNLDDPNRLKLNCSGTLSDLKQQGIELCDGLQLTLYMDAADNDGRSDKLLVDGTVQYNQPEDCWVAAVDWDTMRHESDCQAKAVAAASGTVRLEGAQAETASPAGGLGRIVRRGGVATVGEVETETGLAATTAPASKLPPDARPSLVMVRGVKLNDEYPICEGPNFVGRADEKPVDIDLGDQEPPGRVWLSRQHALITFENGELYVEDLDSANGTFVNRTRIYPGQKHPLSPDDVVQFGAVQLKLKT